MKSPSLSAQPARSPLASRNGGNGGYSQKQMQSEADKKPLAKKSKAIYNYDGKKVRP